ncbi:MAG TPA: AbrB/MazE/SpoVT family DNA-binding domain-containing protein [Bacteroidetes bacterium]|nr:AbrB/MazE/SpoVT family DNA-binding domain-containing protein [Bacteroidota bacterium]
MRINIVKIGNSKGLILPKIVLEKYQIKNEVTIKLHDEYLVIEPITKPRIGWNEQFAMANSKEENELLIPDVFEDEEQL